jgi:hypothetical protein
MLFLILQSTFSIRHYKSIKYLVSSILSADKQARRFKKQEPRTKKQDASRSLPAAEVKSRDTCLAAGRQEMKY